MTRVLVISVRFHDGRYHGAGDWPPSPARLFQALVSAAAQSALSQTRREALGWLEKLDVPVIAAPTAHSGQHVSLFVPNNDLDAKGGEIRRVAEIRSATKHIRPRLFDASVPLLYIWRLVGDENREAGNRVCEIANGLYQLGRGVDMAWAVGEVLDEADADIRLAGYRGVIYQPSAGGHGMALDCPEEGSLESLELRHQAGAQRFRRVENRTEFANAPKPRFRSVAYNSPATRLLFELRRTTAPGSPFAPWPLKKATALVQKLRGNDGSDGQLENGAFARLAKHCNRGEVSKVLIGRDAAESDKALRIRIVPLPSIGHIHADRSIRRVLVEVPLGPISADDVKWAFSGLEIESQEVDVESGGILYSPVELVATDDNSMLKHYGFGDDESSQLWRSVTPLALPESAARRRIDPAKQREQAKSGAERLSEEQQARLEIAQALRHAGFRHRVANVRVQREPFEGKGERAEVFAAGTRFAKARLWHAEVEFDEPIAGPLILGDGRYMGLGVMYPVHRVEGVYCFAIVEGLDDQATERTLVQALRRAVMARVPGKLGARQKLPEFFSGHQPDGTPMRNGTHEHLAFAADVAHRRVIVIAPHVLENRQPTSTERDKLSTLDMALANFTELRAGHAGRLMLSRSSIDLECDAIFKAARVWESVTDFHPTRYLKRVTGQEVLIADATSEINKLGLPMPSQVEVLELFEGARGGISGRLRLVFAIAVCGLIMIGRTKHKGGGLFAAVQ